MVPHDGTNLARPTHPRQRLPHRSTPPLHPTTTPHTTQPTTHRRLPIPTIRHLRRRRNRTRIHPQQPRKPPHTQPHLQKTTPPTPTPPPPPMVLPLMGHLRQSNGQQNARNPRPTIHRSIPTTQRQNLTPHPPKIPILQNKISILGIFFSILGIFFCSIEILFPSIENFTPPIHYIYPPHLHHHFPDPTKKPTPQNPTPPQKKSQKACKFQKLTPSLQRLHERSRTQNTAPQDIGLMSIHHETGIFLCPAPKGNGQPNPSKGHIRNPHEPNTAAIRTLNSLLLGADFSCVSNGSAAVSISAKCLH